MVPNTQQINKSDRGIKPQHKPKDCSSPFHDSFGFHRLVAVQAPELALVLFYRRRHAVGQVLPAVRDHVPDKIFVEQNIFSNICFMENIFFHLVTLCWAVKAQGQGQRRERVARWEHSRRSSGITLESMRRSEMLSSAFGLDF